MNYKVLLPELEEGFSVSCPGLPGCQSQEATEEEALRTIQDAIAEYLAAADAIYVEAFNDPAAGGMFDQQQFLTAR